MPLASGANVGLSYVKEATRGTTPGSPAMKTLRAMSRNINKTRSAVVSQERRQDRQVADMRHGFEQVGGSLGYELSVASFDDMLEGAMSSTWVNAPTHAAVNLAAAATTNKFTRASGSWINDGFYPGLEINVTGFATGGNNGRATVVSVTALDLFVNKTLTTEASAAARTIAGVGKILKVGSTLTTYTFERRFPDVAQYQVFRGIAINSMSISMQPDQMIGGTLELLGMSGGAFAGSSLGNPAAAPSNSPLVAFQANILVDGVAQAVVTSLDLTIANGRSVQPVCGSRFSPDVFEGTAQVTGNLSAFFENPTLHNIFENELEKAVACRMDDPNGTDFLAVAMPRVKFSSSTMDPPQEGPVTSQYQYQALVDSATNTTLIIQRSN